ncbi:sphingosine kinase 2-like isoform X5 [Varroa destructor]|uniref:sphingosine kinase n=1 Tax=Varroa destructor TaxID=109461 RepID=A0A7M7KGG3_VARDE|nr:sphingosine kinase 2-like isoform X5 [Varroa destructor]
MIGKITQTYGQWMSFIFRPIDALLEIILSVMDSLDCVGEMIAGQLDPHGRTLFSFFVLQEEETANDPMGGSSTQNGAPGTGAPSAAKPRVILDGCYYRYPNTTSLRYQLQLYENEFVFQAKGKTTRIKMEDVIGCHVMRLSTASCSANEHSAFFCIYAYHLASGKGLKGASGLTRQRHTYVFEVDVCATYENNLRAARKWQSACLWILRGYRFETNQDTGDIIVPESLPAQRRYLCLVNPKSGPGRSLEIFLDRVRPVLSEADISYLMLVTERFNHAREFVRNLELNQWSGIIIVSGDGLLHEVYNGLMERPDADQAIRIPVGIIPGGSGNGLARSICHASGEPYLSDPVLACTLSCVKGRVQPLDLCKIDMPKKEPIYSFLSYGWGIMSDIDIESEKLRSFGEIRFTLWALWRIFSLRTYSGRVSYLPATEQRLRHVPVIKKSSVPAGEVPNSETIQPEQKCIIDEEPISDEPLASPSLTSPTLNSKQTKLAGAGFRSFASGIPNDNFVDTEQVNESRVLRSRSVFENISKEVTGNGPLKRVEDDGIDRCKNLVEHVTVSELRHAPPPKNRIFKGKGSKAEDDDKDSIDQSVAADVNGNAPSRDTEQAENSEPQDTFPGVDDPLPPSWQVEEGRFVIIYSSLVSHLGTKLFFAPQARLDDGVCWLMMIKGEASRRQIASFFINQEVGRHVDLPWVRLLPVRAFRVESFDDSIMTIDGEVVDTNSVQDSMGKPQLTHRYNFV